MGKREFVFGEKEKHTLEISWSYWTGVATIKIDGQKKNDLFWNDVGHRSSYDYTVGTDEVHSVHVKVGYGVNTPSITVTVDGKDIVVSE